MLQFNLNLLPLTTLLAALTACAGFGLPALQPGQDEAAVKTVLGTPNARHALPAGATRLEFARGPMGRETWMVDLDASGHVTRWVQALAEPRLHAFQQRAPGMPQHELLRTLGRPAERRAGGWAGGEVWSYRYFTNDCLWFQVSLGDDHVVRDAGFGIDPRCDDRRPGLP